MQHSRWCDNSVLCWIRVNIWLQTNIWYIGPATACCVSAIVDDHRDGLIFVKHFNAVVKMYTPTSHAHNNRITCALICVRAQAYLIYKQTICLSRSQGGTWAGHGFCDARYSQQRHIIMNRVCVADGIAQFQRWVLQSCISKDRIDFITN